MDIIKTSESSAPMGLKPPVKFSIQPPKKSIKRQLYPIISGVFFGVLFAGIFSAVVFVFAVPPTSKYDFSETLDPSCTPGSTNCTVESPAAYSFGANNFSGTGGFTGGSLTIDTNTLYVDATNNFVGIGTASPSYPLHIVGNQYLESGNLGIGATPYTYGVAGDEWVINTDRTFTDTTAGAFKGTLKGETYWNPNVASVLQYVSGLTFSLNSTPGSTVNNTGYFQAMEASALWRSNGTLTNDRGLVAKAGTYNSGSSTTGTVTDASAIYAYVTKATGSTITNAYGLYLQAVAGTTNAYGVYVNNVTGTNAYDIYANDSSAYNYFAGKVGIGKTDAYRKVEILDTSTQLRLTHTDATYYTDFNTTSSGDLDINPSGGDVNIAGNIHAVSSSEVVGEFTSSNDYPTLKIRGTGVNTNPLISFRDADSNQIGVIGADEANGILTFGISSIDNDYLTINSSGKVGIGTASPDNKLTIANGNFNSWLTGGSNVFSTRSYSDTATENSYFTMQRARGSSDSPTVPQSGDRIGTLLFSGYNGTNYADAVAAIRAYAGATLASGNTPGYLVFLTTPSGSGTELERMRIDSAGNVGIGTTDPGFILDIQKESGATVATAVTKFGDDANGAANILRSARGTQASPTATQSGDAIGAWGARGYKATGFSSTSSARIQAIATENFTDSAIGAKLAFDTIANGTTTATTRMTIDQSGYVGIGTTSPENVVHISGTGFVTPLIESTDGSAQLQTISYRENANHSKVQGAAARGTKASPDYLNNGDTIYEISGFGWDGTSMLDKISAQILFSADGDHSANVVPGSIGFYTNGGGADAEVSPRMKIDYNGYVGIGTTSPGALLDIGLAGTTLGTMRFEGSTSGYVQIQPAVAAGSYTLTLPTSDGDASQVLTTDGSGVLSWTDKSAAMTYPGAGIAVSTGSAWGTSLAVGTDIQAYDDELAGLAGLTYSSGTPFVKMTAAGTFSLDTNTYMTNPMTTVGDIIYGGASGTATRLASGTTGQILQTNTGAAPSWSTATYPSTITANYVLYATGTNTIGSGSALTFDGSTLNITGTSAAQQKLSYNGSIYSSLTVGSDGTLTVANTGGATGDIVLQPTGTGDVALLSDTGVMTLGGNAGSNNEDLSFDFETTANTVALTSSTGVSNITWTGNLTLGGNTTVGTLVTRVVTSAPTEADVNGSLVVDSGDGGRIYFRYGGAWHYVAQTAGFQIPGFETTDPISGEQIQEGDIVLGMINKTFSDNALHGVWVKWDSVKAQLLAEARGQLMQGGGYISEQIQGINGVNTETFLKRVENTLVSLGISVKDGITNIAQLAVERLTAKNARVETLEMVDKATGEVYCTWVENGEVVKARGECGSVEVASANPQPVGQSIEQAQEIIEKAQQAANNALESTQHAQQAVQENAKQAVEEAAKQTVKEAKEEIKQEVKQELAEEQQAEEQQTEESVQNSEVSEPIEEPVENASESSVEQSPAEQPLEESNVEPVQEEQAPVETESQENPVSMLGELIKDSVAGLLQATVEFVKLIFGAFANLAPASIKDSISNFGSNADSFVVGFFDSEVKTISSGINSATAALSDLFNIQKPK